MSTTSFLGKRELNAAYRVLLRVTILIIVRGKIYLGGLSSVFCS
jgi:hypothetical protein